MAQRDKSLSCGQIASEHLYHPPGNLGDRVDSNFDHLILYSGSICHFFQTCTIFQGSDYSVWSYVHRLCILVYCAYCAKSGVSIPVTFIHIGGWVDPTCTFYRHQDSGNSEVKTFSNTSSCRIPWNDLSYFIAVGNRVGIDIRKVSSWSCSRISDLLDWWPWHVFTDASSLQPLDWAKKQDVNMPFHFIHSIFLWIWKVWVTVARSLG